MGRKNLGGGGSGKGVNKESEAQLWLLETQPLCRRARAEMSERAGVQQAGGQDRAGAISGPGCS